MVGEPKVEGVKIVHHALDWKPVFDELLTALTKPRAEIGILGKLQETITQAA